MEATWGGCIAENVVQALSRLVVTDAMLRIEADPSLNANVVLTVHDEVVLIAKLITLMVQWKSLSLTCAHNHLGRRTSP